MLCKNCGNNIENRTICPYCGFNNYTPPVQQQQNVTKKGSNMGPIVVILVVLVMAVAVFFIVNHNRVKYEEEETNSTNSNAETSNTNSNSNTNVESNTNTNSSSNISSNDNSGSNLNTNISTNTNTNVTKYPTQLHCTEKVQDTYGTYVATYDYTFRNDKMSSYKAVITGTLNKDYYSYRDSILKQYEDAHAIFYKVAGINVLSKKTNGGFVFQVEIKDTNMIDKAKLRELGFYILNYSGVKMKAYENGLTCH